MGVFGIPPGVHASPQLDITDCLQYTTAQGLRTARILRGLPLTPDQVREVRSRLSQYNSVRGYPGIDDLGLPPAVVAEIKRRIALQVAEWNKHPLGYPCMVFKSPSQTTGFVRQLLLDNGFRRAGLSIRKTSPRQFQLKGIQDGVQMFGIVVKTGKRQVAIFVESVSPRFSQTKRFTTPFEA
jgi:hypothetical protein